MPFDPDKLEAAKKQVSFDPQRLEAVKSGSASQKIYPQQPEISALDAAKQAASYALETPIGGRPEGGGPTGLEKLKSGLESASKEAESFYASRGMPKMAKFAGVGGGIIAESIPTKMKDALLYSAMGPALEAAGAIGKPALRAGGNFLADIAGTIASKDPETIKVLFDKPGAMWKYAGELFGQSRQKALVDAVEESLKAKGMQFENVLKSITGYMGEGTSAEPRINLSKKLDPILDKLTELKHRIPDDLRGNRKFFDIGKISHDDPEYKKINEILGFIKGKTDISFSELLNYRHQLDRVVDYGIEGSNGLQRVSGDFDVAVKSIRKQIDAALRDSVPSELRGKWDSVNSAYSKARDAHAAIKKEVLGTASTPRNVEKKMLQMISEGRYDDEMVPRLQNLSKMALREFDDARAHVAARSMSRWGGFTGKILPTSPRAIGYGASAAGAASKLAEYAAQMATKHPQVTAMLSKIAEEQASRNQKAGPQ